MGSVLQFARDSVVNLVANLGTSRDKAAASTYDIPVIDDAQISNAYRGAWLPRKIVDIPAFDSVRAWRHWQAKGDQIEAIEAEEKRLNVKGKVLEARIKARLWGGAAILIGTGDASLAGPLDVERVRKGGVQYLTVMSRRVLTAGEIERDPGSEFYGRPRLYQLQTATGAQVDIHPSRLAIFMGNQQPDDDLVLSQFPGWGDPVLVAVFDAIRNADATAANVASMVFEAKIDVFRIPNFMANVGSAAYRADIIERFSLAATTKSINGALILDKDEEYETKGATFAQLPEVLDRFLQIVSGAADIPATRLLGQSPAGMNATGESDLRNYYDRLSAMQDIEMSPAMFRLDEALIRSATGARDPNIYCEWAPLWELSEKEKADIFKTKADAARTIAGTGGTSQPLMPIDALSDALVNELVEDGSLSGLEAAIEEYGRLSEQEDDEEDIEAAGGNMPSQGTSLEGLSEQELYGDHLAVSDNRRRHRRHEAEAGEHGSRLSVGRAIHFDPAKHPRGAGGRFTESGGGAENDLVALRPASSRAFDGKQVEIKHKFATKKEAGDTGERIAKSYLASAGYKNVRSANSERSNYPVDVAHDGGLVEVKTGLASNGSAAQQWRATIGQPGKAETAWLKTASKEEKAAHNAKKAQAILDRKNAALKTFASEGNVKKPTAHTVAVILNPDTKTADIYHFVGFHSRIGWNSEAAARGYVGSVTYE